MELRDFYFALIIVFFQILPIVFLPHNMSKIQKLSVILLFIIGGVITMMNGSGVIPVYSLLATLVITAIVGVWKKSKLMTIYGISFLMAFLALDLYSTYVLPPDA